MVHSPQYTAYLASPRWAATRAAAIAHAGHCERCGRRWLRYEVHHRHYRTLGHEDWSDLQVLCTTCHDIMDACRRAGLAL